MGERRPRADCPFCGRDTALTTKAGVIGPHSDPTGRSRQGSTCDGVGMKPGELGYLVRLVDLVLNLEDYIERRALEIACERVASMAGVDPIRRAVPELEHRTARTQAQGGGSDG